MGAATFLYDRRLAFMLGGLAVNALGVAVALRRLRRFPGLCAHVHHEEAMACAASWSPGRSP